MVSTSAIGGTNGTVIAFTVEQQGPVQLDVYDIAGRHVRALARSDYAPGPQAVTWDGTADDGRKLPSGLYFYQYRAGGKTMIHKMMLVR